MRQSRTVTMSARRLGLGKIDVVVLLFVVLGLVGMSIPFLLNQHRSAHRAHCANNLRVLGTAIYDFHKIKPESLPPSRLADGYATWPILIAPYMKSNPLADLEVSRKPYVDLSATVREATLPVMYCPARAARKLHP